MVRNGLRPSTISFSDGKRLSAAWPLRFLSGWTLPILFKNPCAQKRTHNEGVISVSERTNGQAEWLEPLGDCTFKHEVMALEFWVYVPIPLHHTKLRADVEYGCVQVLLDLFCWFKRHATRQALFF